ncbi:hypothetical protein K8I85_10500 [bacterium]|nr:hypothetical protein [bacterium]
MYRIFLAGVLLTGLIVSSAVADRRSEPLTSHASITNGNAHRVLFKAEGLRSMESVAISRARIEFDVTGAVADRVLYLRLCPVTTPWTAASAQWSSGWRRPGGDFDEDLGADAVIDLSHDSQKAVFDVTPILKEWLEQGAEFSGFILTVQPREGREGIRGEDVDRLQALATASLVVDYRTVPSTPRQRHRGG